MAVANERGTPMQDADVAMTSQTMEVCATYSILFFLHSGVELRANLESISHRCYLFEVAFARELT